MPDDSQLYLSAEYQAHALAEFVARHVKPYDPATDEYERPPFAEDIKEGKNDPIYNAHSYHTKVPPRSIIPYILHYTQPGDVVLDPFCGSGMTGVAAQMCADPPADLLAQFPDLKDRVGPRTCILNDLSPAACHIAYNYNTAVDVEALRCEFERIKAAVKDEFDWLYGTEHYEPAVGLYSPTKSEVLVRLKNPPVGAAHARLIDSAERTWELLTRTEVESRLGYPVTDLPRDSAWGDLDVSQVPEWICIPATIQYTIWSDVYRCEGFVTVEEPTGKLSTRGKNAGKPIVRKRRVQRGCGESLVLWDAAVDATTGDIADPFKCPKCAAEWKKLSLTLSDCVPVRVTYKFSAVEGRERLLARPITEIEKRRVYEIEAIPIGPLPDTLDGAVDMGREMMRHGNLKRGLTRLRDFYTTRNLRALCVVWNLANQVPSHELSAALRFSITSVINTSSRMRFYRPTGPGDVRKGTLYVASLTSESNVLEGWSNKVAEILPVFAMLRSSLTNTAVVRTGHAANFATVPSESIDYVFTDPPFGSNIFYADCSLLWEAWLGVFTNEQLEIVVSDRRKDGPFKTLDDYSELMENVFHELFRVLKPGRWATVEFNNSDGKVFNGIKSAVLNAGFRIENMLLLDKTQKSFKQLRGVSDGEDVVDKDVLFNLHKPAVIRAESQHNDHDLEHQVTDAVRQHLLTLPTRIAAEPAKYSDEHRTTATINSMLMNALIPRGVSVEQLNLPFIERVCSRYFRKIGQHWYLRGEAIGGNGNGGLFEEEVVIRDSLSAIDWLRQKLRSSPMLIGELKPLWMRATGLLPAEVSHEFVLEELLLENFWRDQDTNRWREPTDDERERMNDDRSLRVLHDAERYIAGTLRRTTNDAERCDWIDVLFKACRQVEEGDIRSTPTLRDFDTGEGYRLITRLFQSVLRDHVSPSDYSKASKQASVASKRVTEGVRRDEEALAAARKKNERTLFD